MKYWLSALKESYQSNRIMWWGVLVVFLISLIPRLITIDAFLPEYSIDENEIVEYPLGFFGGDKDPLWYKYGPFYWYLLFYVYKVQALFSGLGADAFVERYFIDNVPYYLSARIVNSFIHIGLGLVGFMICHRHINRNAAPYVLLLGIFPFADMFTSFKPRVDSLLALCAIISLYYSLDWLKDRNRWSYILAGLFMGFSLSAKPLPALLLMPTLALIYAISEIELIRKDRKRKLDARSVLKGWFANGNLYLAVLAMIFGFFITNPYALFDMGLFVKEQIVAVQTEGGREFESGASLNKFFLIAGYPFTMAAVMALLYSMYDGIKRKKWVLLALSSYVLVFYLAFAMGASREYFYIPVIPLCAVLIGYYLHRLLANVKFAKEPYGMIIKFGIALLLFAQPFWTIAKTTPDILRAGGDYSSMSPALAAGEWIRENIAPGSRILYYGYYTSLPRLFDRDLNEQASYGDYFMYNRNQNKYWIERYSKAMNDYHASGGLSYDIVYQINADVGGTQRQFYTRYESQELDPILLKTCAVNGIFYVVTHYSPTVENTGWTLVKEYTTEEYPAGLPVRIYSLNRQ